jgi:hypothetical protein
LAHAEEFVMRLEAHFVLTNAFCRHQFTPARRGRSRSTLRLKAQNILDLREMEHSAHWDSQRARYPLQMILLQASNGVPDFLAHDAVDWAAIITVISQTDLQGSDIGWVFDQFSSGLQPVIIPIVMTVRIIDWNYELRLVKYSPFISWSQRIPFMKKRSIGPRNKEKLFCLGSNGGSHQSQKEGKKRAAEKFCVHFVGFNSNESIDHACSPGQRKSRFEQ